MGGIFDVYDSTGNLVGTQSFAMTSLCSGTGNFDTTDGKHLPFNFKVSMTDVQVEHVNAEREDFTGNVMGDGFSWSNGLASRRSGPVLPSPSNPVSCHQDEDRLVSF